MPGSWIAHYLRHMALSLKVDLSTTGVLNVTDDADESVMVIPLGQVVSVGQANQDTFTSDATFRTGIEVVSITYNTGSEFPSTYTIDIRSVIDPVYATTQDLVDAINAAIAAM